MLKIEKTLSLALDSVAVGNGADADAEGWVELPADAQDTEIVLEGADTAALTALIELKGALGPATPYHQEVFTADGVVPVEIGSGPYSFARVSVTARTTGQLNAYLYYRKA